MAGAARLQDFLKSCSRLKLLEKSIGTLAMADAVHLCMETCMCFVLSPWQAAGMHMQQHLKIHDCFQLVDADPQHEMQISCYMQRAVHHFC